MKRIEKQWEMNGFDRVPLSLGEVMRAIGRQLEQRGLALLVEMDGEDICLKIERETAEKTGVELRKPKMKFFGRVATDTGELLVIDPCHIQEYLALSKAERKQFLAVKRPKDAKAIKFKNGTEGLAVAFQSEGDGLHGVWGAIVDYGSAPPPEGGEELVEVRICIQEPGERR